MQQLSAFESITAMQLNSIGTHLAVISPDARRKYRYSIVVFAITRQHSDGSRPSIVKSKVYQTQSRSGQRGGNPMPQMLLWMDERRLLYFDESTLIIRDIIDDSIYFTKAMDPICALSLICLPSLSSTTNPS